MAGTAFLSALAGTLLSGPAWLGSLEDARAYDRAPVAIADQVVAWVAAQPDDRPRTLAPLNGSDLRAVVVMTVTPDWLRQEARLAVPGIVSAASSGGTSGMVISLRDLKGRLADGSALIAVLDQIATWPSCTAAQLARLAGGDLIRCRPPTDQAGQLAVIISGRLGTVAAELPDEVDLTKPGEAPGSGALVRAGLPETLALAVAVSGLLSGLVLVIVALVILAILAAGGPVVRRLWVLSAAFLAGGLCALALALAQDALLAGLVTSLGESLADGGLVPAMVEIVATTARSLLDRAGWQVAWTGVTLLSVGLVALLAGLIAGRRVPSGRAIGTPPRG